MREIEQKVNMGLLYVLPLVRQLRLELDVQCIPFFARFRTIATTKQIKRKGIDQ